MAAKETLVHLCGNLDELTRKIQAVTGVVFKEWQENANDETTKKLEECLENLFWDLYENGNEIDAALRPVRK